MEIVPLSSLRDNYIWALSAQGACVVVDPAEAAPVRRFLAQSGLRLTGILLTHRHADHVGGVADLLADSTVPVFGPASPQMPMVSQVLHDGQQLTLPTLGETVTVLAVPGHTEEHIAYRSATALFCGDTLFAAGCGRLLGGTAAQLHTSLRRIAELPGDTRICCAHEYTLANLRFAQAVEPKNPALAARILRCQGLREQGHPTLPPPLAEEWATNPFLRCTEAPVRAAAERVAGHPLADDLAVFTALRSWKDHF